MARGLTPAELLGGGLDWTGRTSQLGYLIALVTIAAALAGWWYLESIDAARWIIFLALLPTSILLFLFAGHQMRRLNDMGWSGWTWWVLFLPLANAILILASLTVGGGRRYDMGVFRQGPAILAALLVCVLLILRSYIAPHLVTQAGMKPALMPGDIVLVMLAQDSAMVGDTVAIRQDGATRSFRVVGAAGDTVQMSDGTLILNGAPITADFAGTFDEVMQRQGPEQVLPRCENGAVAMGARCRKSILTETLPSGVTYPTLNAGDQRSDEVGAVLVPEGYVFVLGDNRDVAYDSRMSLAARGTGLVPLSAIEGRVSRVVISAPGAYVGAFWTWDRFWVAVE